MKWTLTPASAFADKAGQWNDLHARCQASPMLAVDFVQPLLTEFADGGELLASCERDGRVVAMTLVAPRGRGAWATFQPAQAPIGLWLQEDQQRLHALLSSLMASLPGLPLVFGLTQCDPDLMARPTDSDQLRTMDYIDTAKITLAGSFDEYWNARGKNLRSNLKKQRAKLDKEGVTLRLQVSRAHKRSPSTDALKARAGRPAAAPLSAPIMTRAAIIAPCSKASAGAARAVFTATGSTSSWWPWTCASKTTARSSC
jgi:hypothetical protein